MQNIYKICNLCKCIIQHQNVKPSVYNQHNIFYLNKNIFNTFCKVQKKHTMYLITDRFQASTLKSLKKVKIKKVRLESHTKAQPSTIKRKNTP